MGNITVLLNLDNKLPFRFYDSILLKARLSKMPLKIWLVLISTKTRCCSVLSESVIF